MKLHAVLVARSLVVVALFPALAGCATQADEEPLTPGVLPPGVAEVPWADASEAIIGPGSILHTEARDCPVNYLFTREDNGAVFLGTTAYCVRDLGIGALAWVGAENHIAMLVYSSFITMSEVRETDDDALEYNDFAVFHLSSSSRAFANPTLGIGGPVALADGSAYGIGSRLRAFIPTEGLPNSTQWREGVVTGSAGEWTLHTYTLPAGAPGTLGGPVIDEAGRAVGVLVTLGILPNPGANGVMRLDTAMAYAAANARLPLVLATQTSTASTAS